MPETKQNPTYKLELTSSPHIHSRWSTMQAMWLVVIALIPTVIAAVLFFGFYQLLNNFSKCWLCTWNRSGNKSNEKKRSYNYRWKRVNYRLVLALIIPPNFSLSSTALGSIVAIAIGKEVFGGLGYNIFNPALVGRAFLQAAFPVQMTTWTQPNFAVDGVSSATPLSAFKFDSIIADNQSLMLGNIGGSLGETSAIAVLIGGIFLIAIGVVNWRVPLSTIVGVILFGGIFWLIDSASYPTPLFHLFAGGFLFGALFMATDWVTSPLTKKECGFTDWVLHLF